jgi:aryl-alcohol dehydrogenase-like predicted oxidoreductase
MRYRNLGNTGLRVSELCLGCMTFGGKGGIWDAIGGLDEKAATALVERSLEAGVNFFDTANGYGEGDSERMLGRALWTRRKDVVIATKVGFATGEGPNGKGLSRAHIFREVDESLRRLGTDWIDLYIAHRRDPWTPLEETVRAFDDLVRAGKVRYVGLSNFPAWQVARANMWAQAEGLTRFESLQAYYNLAARDIEREAVPLLRSEKIGLMVWSPLAGGVLSGKYSREGKAPEGARRATLDLGPIDWPRVNRVLDAAREIAAAHGRTVAQVALAWLLAQEVVSTVVIGAKRMDQLEDNLAAATLTLTAEELKRLTEASDLPPEYPGWFLAFADPL